MKSPIGANFMPEHKSVDEIRLFCNSLMLADIINDYAIVRDDVTSTLCVAIKPKAAVPFININIKISK